MVRRCEQCNIEIDRRHKRFCSLKCLGRFTKPIENTVEKFWSRVDKSGECWVWLGRLDHGYGQYRYVGRGRGAHVVGYMIEVGEVPEGMELDHLCRNRACVRASHLEPVTQLENMKRSPLWTGNRTHCPQGHPYSEGNTYPIPTGGRGCRACRKENSRRYKAKLRLAA